ncbi:alpha/beta hydrolase [Pullulanibacillus sp. KACC 23026]|uniref:alpha/beta fold hydrolase n=1 Tax=Pullulanibacillus sp. KACC 23026 TaxID=3028315 RepID=UPI0023AEA858|nr:alpha/beta hydrolase [Pullulanibacillus sp. KACC 23026]WEG13844.1 alpha/beta hydrolase [Pullulanibacillus sp. KACC 23026]
MWVWETKLQPKGVVVMVHGAGEHHGRYHWLRKKWLDEGFHVVMGDLPGQGRSPKNRGHVDSFDEYIDAVKSWYECAEQFGLPILLLGHSLGGLSVIRTLEETAIHPDLVILSSPCLGLVVPPPEWVKRVLHPVNRFLPTIKVPIKRSGENILATRNEDVLKQDANDPLIVKRISVRWYFELDQAMKEATNRIHRFPNVPTIILQAGADRIVDKHAVYRWFRQLPVANKHYKEWKDFYHEVFNEPERETVFLFLTRRIKAFI